MSDAPFSGSSDRELLRKLGTSGDPGVGATRRPPENLDEAENGRASEEVSSEATTVADRPSDTNRPPSPAPKRNETFPPLAKSTTSKSSSSAIEAAQILATFSTHPSNPRNWSHGKKWRITMTVAVTGFVSTSGSSIGVPGIHAIVADFGLDNEKLGVLVTTFYVLGLGAGPFVFAPISELYGRQFAYLSSQILFFLFTIGTAVSPNLQTLVILRFFCGVFGSAGPALGVATCADVWAPEQRGRPVSLYAIGPMGGPVVGSIIGYWILFGGWRWLFWTSAVLAGLNAVLLVVSSSETHAEVIQKKLTYRVHHPISPPTSFASRISPWRIIHDLGWMSAMVSADHAREVFGKAFSRPPRLLFTNPVCAIFSIYYAYIYAIIYLFLITVPLAFGSPPFNKPSLFSHLWPQSTLSLAYIGLTLGFATAATTAAIAQDRIYKYLSARNKGQGEPEYRLILTQTGMILMPIGLFIFGWTMKAEVHWIAPQIGMFFVAVGLMLAFNSIQNFIVDAFYPYSAAGIAVATACRSLTACILPIFTPDMFERLDWGWGGSLLAFVALIAVPAPLIMFKYGKHLRDRYQFDG